MNGVVFTIGLRFDRAPQKPVRVRGLLRAVEAASAYARAYGWACVTRGGRTVATIWAHDLAEGGAHA